MRRIPRGVGKLRERGPGEGAGFEVLCCVDFEGDEVRGRVPPRKVRDYPCIQLTIHKKVSLL